MSNTELRENLIAQADSAFLTLVIQIDALLDSAKFYVDNFPVITPSDVLKSDNLNTAVHDLGSLPRSIVAEIERWKKEEDRVLSKYGVETQLLNELYSTIEVTMLFFIRENVDLNHFSLSAVKQAYHELLRCNRLL